MDGRNGFEFLKRQRKQRFSAKLEAAPPSRWCFQSSVSYKAPAGPSPAWTHTLTQLLTDEKKALRCSHIKPIFSNCNQSELQGPNLEVCGRTELVTGSEIRGSFSNSFCNWMKCRRNQCNFEFIINQTSPWVDWTHAFFLLAVCSYFHLYLREQASSLCP